jgi:LysM repeat protein
MSDQPATSRFHTVEPQESLATIAKMHGLTVKQLTNWNNLTPSSLIYPGMKLSLESDGSVTTNTALLSVIPATASIPIAANRTCLVHGFHRIKAGETIAKIAALYGLPTHLVLKANQLDWNSPIFIGQKVMLPGVHEMQNCPDVRPLASELRKIATQIIRVGKRLPVADERIVAALSQISKFAGNPKPIEQLDDETVIRLLNSDVDERLLVSAWVWLEQLKVELAHD